jgi:hypothetical protein
VRILDADNDAVGVVDMGAYEVEAEATVSGSTPSFSSAGGGGGGCFISAISTGEDLGLWRVIFLKTYKKYLSFAN